MKILIKIFCFVPLLSLAFIGSANAQGVEFINSDGTDNADLCIAATVSNDELLMKTKQLNMSESDLTSFSCNGYSIADFAEKYKNSSEKTVNVYTFDSDTKNVVVKLCMAAATSNKALKEAMKEANVAKNDLYLIKCNGKSVKTYAKKNGNKKYRI